MNVNRRRFLSGAAACTLTPEELTELRAQESSLPEPLCQRYCQGRKGSTQLANSRPNHRELNS